MTPPIVFTGQRLELNLDTSAMGICQVGLFDAEGHEVPGFAVAACDVVRGNSVRKVVTWNGVSDLAAWSGRPVQLRFVLRAAKFYAFQFTSG